MMPRIWYIYIPRNSAAKRLQMQGLLQKISTQYPSAPLLYIQYSAA
jgi:hypothetical protein